LIRSPRRSKYVTIAAGFKASDGFVLCADTQESGSAFKRRVPKLEIRPNPETATGKEQCKIIVTGAGSSSFVDSLIEEIWKGAKRASESKLDEVTGRITAALIEHYRKIWSIYPKQTNPQLLPTADLMFAVWTKEGSGLYLARGFDVNPVLSYGAVGCGDELAQYVCEPMILPQMNTRQVLFLAIYMLEQVKKNVLDCGGESHIAVLQNDGSVSVLPPLGAYVVGNHLAAFDRSLGHLLLAVVDDQITDKMFKHGFTIFRDEITRLRREYRMNQIELWQEVRRAEERLRQIGRKALLKAKPPSVSRKSKRAQ
jgi:hypothetical protein